MLQVIYLSVFSLLFATQTWAAPAPADDVVATVGNYRITSKEFKDRYEEVVKNTLNPPAKEVFLEDLVRYRVGLQEAKKRKLDEDPLYKERADQELYKTLIEREIGKKVDAIRVTEDEMKAFYSKSPEIRSSHILIEFKPDATEAQKNAARERAKEIYKEVLASKRPFQELVALYSDDPLSKNTGGDVGWQSSITLVPAYYDVILKMKVGEVRGVVETPYGFHIIKVTDRRGYNDANKRTLRAAVFEQRRKAVFDDYFAKIKKTYTINVNKTALK